MSSCCDHNDNNNDSDNNFNPKKELITLIILVILFGIGNILIVFADANSYLYYAGLIILGITYIRSGYTIFKTAIFNLRHGKVFDENFLMSSATVAAIIIGAYSEAVAVILFYRTGEFLQEWAINKSKRSIKALLEFNVDYVTKIIGNNRIKVKAEDILEGDIIEVIAGDKIPLDSIIIDGESLLDLKSLTGESIPKIIKPNDTVLAGSINLSAKIQLKVLKRYSESYIVKILSLVESAKENKAPTEQFITTFAKYYTPAVLFISIAVAIFPPLLGLGSFSTWVYRALVVLVVSCPCALVISIPLGYFASIGAAAKAGILIKGANYLEALTKVSTIAFDKTGTLTKGEFEIVGIIASQNKDRDLLIEVAKYAMINSNHPISKSIIKELKDDIDHSRISKYEELAGLGIKLHFDKHTVLAGSLKLMNIAKIDLPFNEDIETIVYFAMDNIYLGKIILQDTLRDDSIEAINEIHQLGIDDILILSGDKKYIVSSIAKQLGITTYYSELLPIEKADIFKEYISKTSGKTIYIGDGVNDAPVIALSDIGISIANVSSDLALESADIVFMNPSITSISTVLKLAKKTKKIILQNIVFALVIKALFIILGLFGLASIYAAVFGDVGVALLALLNAMRLMKI